MSTTTAKILGALLLFFWLVNLAAVQVVGGDQELYPLTCFPMYKKPLEFHREYYFTVISDPAEAPRRMSVGEMLSGTRTGTGGFQSFFLRNLEDALAKGEPVPEPMAQLWRRNSQSFFGSQHPPLEIRLMRTDYPLDRDLKDLVSSKREIVLTTVSGDPGRAR